MSRAWTCLSIRLERFRGSQKEDECGSLSILFLYGVINNRSPLCAMYEGSNPGLVFAANDRGLPQQTPSHQRPLFKFVFLPNARGKPIIWHKWKYTRFSLIRGAQNFTSLSREQFEIICVLSFHFFILYCICSILLTLFWVNIWKVWGQDATFFVTFFIYFSKHRGATFHKAGSKIPTWGWGAGSSECLGNEKCW